MTHIYEYNCLRNTDLISQLVDVTCSEHREEIKPHQAYDWCSQSLIDSSQVNLAIEAGRQVSEVQVVFVHQVFQEQVQQTCTHGLC